MKAYRIRVKSLETNATLATFEVAKSMIIGREGADIDIADERVSRRHAKLAINRHGHLEITDLGSTNGILVNGVRVLHARLKPGNAIQISSLVIEVLETGADFQRDWPGMWECLPKEKRKRFSEYY